MPLSEMILLAKGKKKLSDFNISWIKELVKQVNITLLKLEINKPAITMNNTGDELIETFTLLPEDVADEIISNVVVGKPITQEDIAIKERNLFMWAFRMLVYVVLGLMIVFGLSAAYIVIVNADEYNGDIVSNFFVMFYELFKVIMSGGQI